MKIQNISNSQIHFQSLRLYPFLPNTGFSKALSTCSDIDSFVSTIDNAGEDIKNLKFTHLMIDSDFNRINILVSDGVGGIANTKCYRPPYNFEIVSPTKILFKNGEKTFDYPDNESMQKSYDLLIKGSKKFKGLVTEDILNGYCELAKQLDKQAILTKRERTDKVQKRLQSKSRLINIHDKIEDMFAYNNEFIQKYQDNKQHSRLSEEEYNERIKEVNPKDLEEIILRNMLYPVMARFVD